MKVKVEKPSKERLRELGTADWPVWTKEKSVFPWEYDSIEICYILEGRARVTADNGEIAEFGKGDLVTFSKGLKCRWEILEDIKKHYKFQ